jgi:hypothetical protein
LATSRHIRPKRFQEISTAGKLTAWKKKKKNSHRNFSSHIHSLSKHSLVDVCFAISDYFFLGLTTTKDCLTLFRIVFGHERHKFKSHTSVLSSNFGFTWVMVWYFFLNKFFLINVDHALFNRLLSCEPIAENLLK